MHMLLGLVVAATASALAPRAAIPVPPAIGRVAVDVAWENADSLLIAGDRGVHRYSLRTRITEPLVSTAPLPDGLPDPEAIASDGTSVVTTSHFSVGGYSLLP